MAKFAQYYLRYNLENLFADEFKDQRQQIFGAFFETNESIVFTSGEGDDRKVYKHQVYHLAQNKNIIVMRIANDKKKTVEQDFKEVEVKHEPSCYVVIDNREQCRRIAIQKNKAFAGSKNVGEIIRKCIDTQMMNTHYIGLELHPQYYPKDFYKAWRAQQHHTARIRFNLCESALPIDFHVKECDDDTIMAFARKVNEEEMRSKYRPVLELNPPNNETCLFVDEESTYIKNLVHFSSCTGNSIEIVTHDGSKFTCFIDSDDESDKVVSNELDTGYFEILFDADADAKEREGAEQKMMEFVNGMKYIVNDEEEKEEAVA
jgi:hypothetical protein